MSASRELKKNDEEDDFDPTADPLLEEVTTPEGASVRFYEADPGSLLVITTLPTGEEKDPLEEYQFETEGKKKDVAEFYEKLTGKKPEGSIKKALNRHKKNKEKKNEREDWDDPEDGEIEVGDAADDNGEGRRELYSVGSDAWWVNRACRFTEPIDFCSCLTSRTGDAYKQIKSDDFYQKVYPVRGTVYQKIEYWKCTGIWPFRSCSWRHLNSDWVYQRELSSLWATSGGQWWYRGTLKYGSGDHWHLSWYDVADVSYACIHAGIGGCYTCPNII